MKSNIIPDKVPDAVKCIDLSTLSFGERVSPCKEPEVFDKYAESFDDETKELYRGKPMSGYIWDEAMLDGKVYFATQRVGEDHLVYRTGRSYDVATRHV